MIPWKNVLIPPKIFVAVCLKLSNTDEMKANASGNLFANSWIYCEHFSLKLLNTLTIQSPSCEAFSFTVSQFLYNRTPIAITAVMAIITRPIGLVRKVKAAPSAVVTAVSTAQIAFHAVIAAVCAQVAAVLAPLTIASLIYSAWIAAVSARSFAFAAIFASMAFFCARNTVTSAFVAVTAWIVSFANFTIFMAAIAPAMPIIIGFRSPHWFNFW